LPVSRIIRVRIGTVELGDLKPREWRLLTSAEVNQLKRLSQGAALPQKTNPTRRAARPLKKRVS